MSPRIQVLSLLLIGCGDSFSPNPVPVPDAEPADSSHESGSAIVDSGHRPDAMPPICGVKTCYALDNAQVLGACDPCQDAGELCYIDHRYGVCQ